MATITVGPSGKDFTTIQAAIAASSASDTINIYNGTYTPTAELEPKANQTIGAAAGQTAVIVNATARSVPGSATSLILLDEDGVTLHDMEIVGMDVRYFHGVGVSGASSSDPVENVTISNCAIHGTGEQGIDCWSATGLTIADCEVYACGTTSNPTTHGIYIQSYCSNVTIERNLIYNNAEQGAHINTQASIGTGIIVRNNKFWGNGHSTSNMDFSNIHDSYVYNNLFLDKGLALVEHLDDPKGVDSNSVFNNTFVLSGKSVCIRLVGPSSWPLYGIATNNVIANNLCFSTATNPTSTTSGCIVNAGTNNTLSNNITKTYSTAVRNEYFVNAAGGDYHLKSTSPARDAGCASATNSVAGTKTAPTTDYDGHARPQ